MAKQQRKPRATKMPKEAQEVQDKLIEKIEEYESREAKEKAAQQKIDGAALRVAEELAGMLADMRKFAYPQASKLSALEKSIKDLRRIFG